MEGAVEIRENLNSNTTQQESNQTNVEADNTATTTTESPNVNQPQQTSVEPIKSEINNANPAEPSAEVPSKNESDEQNNPAEDQNTQDLDPNSQENQNEQENDEENKQPEKAKAKKKKKNNSSEKTEVSEERKGQVMSYVKALMGMHYMKNDGIPAEILPGFYLGSIGAAFNRKLLEENKIGHILCCCDGVKQSHPEIFKYKMLKLLDKPTEDITRYFEEASDYIHEILTKGEKVLVHCFAGKSRSTTIMISYLLKHHNMSVDEAIALIRSKRSVIQPNLGFVAQLRLYEKKLKEKLGQVEKTDQ